MYISHLTPKTLHAAILRGCQSVVAAREKLNEINVFPVADGDTGDNLASTANAIIRYSEAKTSFHDMLNSVADASVLGARGNSGLIFSQFFNALASHPCNKETMDTFDFSDMLAHVAQRVRASLSSPMDGTILTMVEIFSNTLSLPKNLTACFNATIGQLLPVLQETLNKTTQAILVLQQANVVDAGALGFYLFAQGFANFSAETSHDESPQLESSMRRSVHEAHAEGTRPLNRYCTEAILRADKLDEAHLMQLLEVHGDSLGFAGNERIGRFHIHTNTPAAVFSTLIDHGVIEHPKVDDMLRQFEVTHERKHDIALVTDSCADIPQALKDEYQVHVIPVNVHLDEHSLLDRHCFDADTFYQRLLSLKKHPKTSLPSLNLIEEKLHYLSQHYREVIVLCVAKPMSGTYDAMMQTAKKYSNVTVVDSRTNSGGQGLLVQYAGELILQKLPVQTIIELIEAAINDSYLFVMVNELDSMIRSGRISKIAGLLGQFSRIKPIISFDKQGNGTFQGSAFNAKKALLKMIDCVQDIQRKTGKELDRYCIVHAGVKEKAHEFAVLTTQALKMPPAYIEDVSTAIGLHAGYGCIELAIKMKDV